MQNLEWYLADLKSTGKNTIETVEKSLTDMFIRLVRIYGLTTLNKPKSREVSTNDGIITQNIFNAAVPTSIETK